MSIHSMVAGKHFDKCDRFMCGSLAIQESIYREHIFFIYAYVLSCILTLFHVHSSTELTPIGAPGWLAPAARGFKSSGMSSARDFRAAVSTSS